MMQVPKAVEATGVFETRVTHMLQLRTFIAGVERVGEILHAAKSPLLQTTGRVSLAWIS
jgi:hypothetical protein